LSEEWATLLAEQKSAAPAEFEISVEPAESAEALFSEAAKAHEPPAIVPPQKSPVVAEFEVSIESPGAKRETEELSTFELSGTDESVAEVSLPDQLGSPQRKSVAEISRDLPPVTEAEAQQPATEPAAVAPRVSGDKQKSAEPEFEVEQDYELVLEPEALVPAYDQKPPETAPKNACPACE